jgi:3-hydroxybutyryl-CoA dehydrogenase
MPYAIVKTGESRSFPDGDAFLAGAVAPAQADVVIYCGAAHTPDPSKAAILVELGQECLGEHTGEDMGEEGSNVLGFARYRNGSDAPSDLVELVRQPNTPEAAIAAAREAFAAAGFAVAVCSDQAGRIIDRLVRPKYNAALRLLDEGLATQKDMDLTCRLGLGYADGPIERVVRGGLAHHYEVTKGLFETYGAPGYAPARRAVVAAARQESSKDKSA